MTFRQTARKQRHYFQPPDLRMIIRGRTERHFSSLQLHRISQKDNLPATQQIQYLGKAIKQNNNEALKNYRNFLRKSPAIASVDNDVYL